jgi:hypothetical protein
VVTDWAGVKPPLVEEDREFLEKKDKLQEWEQQLTSASQQVISSPSMPKAQNFHVICVSELIVMTMGVRQCISFLLLLITTSIQKRM